VIRVYDDAGNVIEAHQQAGEFKELYRDADRLLK
jgi:YD repeat-containing protein